MNRTNHASKLFAFLLVALFFGSSLSVLADAGNRGDGDDYGVVLNMDETEQTVSRGEVARYGGIIRNTGTLNDTYRISFGGEDYGLEGVTVEFVADNELDFTDLDNLSIPAGEKLKYFLKVVIDRDEDENSGDEHTYEISLLIRSNSDDDTWDAVRTYTTVIPDDEKEYDFELRAHEDELTTVYNEPVTFTMALYNTGNVEDTYTASIVFPDGYDNFRINAFLYRIRGSDEKGTDPDEDGDDDGVKGEDTGNDDDDEQNGNKGSGAGDVTGDFTDTLTFSLKPDQKMLFALQVTVYGDDVYEPGDDPLYDLIERYLVNVLAKTKGDPDLMEMIKTVTTIKFEEPPQEIFFECYEPDKTIRAGGMSEFYLYLSNYGWSQVTVSFDMIEHQYPDIEMELYLMVPYWQYEDCVECAYPGQGDSAAGMLYDADGNLIYLGEDDVVYDDYGGLIPINDSYTYVVNPYETVQLLLRVNHLYETPEPGNDTPALYSADYEIGVTAKIVDADDTTAFMETIMTTTTVIFNPQYSIDMQIKEPRQVTYPERPVEYIINLKNTGNVEETVKLSIGGEAWGLEGVYGYLYAMNGWGWEEPVVYYDENGNKMFHYPYDYTTGSGAAHGDYRDETDSYEINPNTDPAWIEPYFWPGQTSDELLVYLDAGEEIKVVLSVTIIYQEGTFNLTVDGVVTEDTTKTAQIETFTTVKEYPYQGFELTAFVTEQSATFGEQVDYQMMLYNPGYYTEEISLNLGGKHVNDPAVDAELFIQRNIYYFEPYAGEFLREDNGDYRFEQNGVIYDPDDLSEKELREKYPEWDETDFPWYDENGNKKQSTSTRSAGSVNVGDKSYVNEDGSPNEYYFDSSGAIYKNYEYEYDLWDGTDGYDEDEWLIPVRDGQTVTVGPFETVWLILRVTVNDIVDETNQTDDTTTPGSSAADRDIYNIDLIAKSVSHPEYIKVVSTFTTIREAPNHGLDLFIGDPVHYTAYGITTIYAFQLTNTGDVRDAVYLNFEGEDAFLPNVYVEIGVHNQQREPVFMMDEYGNTILPSDKVFPAQRTGDGPANGIGWGANGEDTPGSGTAGGSDDSGNSKDDRNIVTVDGSSAEGNWQGLPPGLIDWSGEDDNGASPGSDEEPYWDSSILWGEPVEYSSQYWGSDSGNDKWSDDVSYWNYDENGETDPGYFDLDDGFMPSYLWDNKYVELEAGETVIVTMKVTIYDPDMIWYYDGTDGYLDDYMLIEDDDEDENGIRGDGDSTDPDGKQEGPHEEEKEREQMPPYIMPPEHWPTADKDEYVIVLSARSVKAPGITAEAKTVTHLYDEEIEDGIKEQRVPGIISVNDRQLSKEILEEGFQMLPTLVESGRIEITINADFDSSRVVIINLNGTNLDELGDFSVLFDELNIRKIDVGQIMDYDGTDARYAVRSADGGKQLLVYVPHFSEHTISIESTADTETTSGDSSDGGLMITTGLIIGLVLGIVALGYIRDRQDSDKNDFKLKLHEDPNDFPTSKTEGTGTETETADELDKLLNESLFIDNLEKKL